MLDYARKMSYLLKQPFETSAEAMVRMREASILIDRLVMKIEETKPIHKKRDKEIIDVPYETEINPHENLDEADIAEEIDSFTRNNVGFD
jgi:hypothetical protein